MTDARAPTHLSILSYAAFEPGTRLIVLGAVHGNETCGTHAIRRIAAEIDAGAVRLARGALTMVPVTNPLAYRLGQRVGDRNLNRNLRRSTEPQDFEDRVANVLCPLLDANDVLLDLHSFHTGGEPFAMLGPVDNDGPLEPFARAAEEEALVMRLGVRRVVDGWLDTYARGVARRVRAGADASRQALLNTDPCYGVGTTEYMRAQGGCALTLECGQHDDPRSPEIAYAAIRNTLAHLGLTDEPAPEPVRSPEVLRIDEVIDRAHPDDRLARAWRSFDPVRAGEVVGIRHDGSSVLAEVDGYVLFPNPNAVPGQEWFYLARANPRLQGVRA